MIAAAQKFFGSFFQKSTASSPPPSPSSPPAAPPPPLASAEVAFFRIATPAGAVLSLDGSRLVLAPALDAAHAAIALLPAAMPNVCLLIAPDGRAFTIDGDADHGVAAAARLVRSDLRQAILLRYPWGASFLAIVAGAVRFDGRGDSPDAIFALHALAPEAVPAAARALAREVGGAAAQGGRAGALLEAVRRGACRAELAASLIRILPRDEHAELGRLLLANPADRALLRRILPDDPWAATHLPALAAWNAARAPAGQDGILTAPASDEAALLHGPFSPNLVGTGMALQSLARRAALPRRGACVLACARNEGAYLLDWVSYHLSIGFEHIFLYTNDNTDGSDELLGLLASHGALTWVRNECGAALSPQLKCYAHALRMLPQILDYRWAAVIDLDEYVGFDPARYNDFNDFIGQMEVTSTDAVALCWLLHAAQPMDRWSPASSLTRFPMRDRGVNPHVKTIFRPGQFWFSLPHDPISTLGAAFEFRTPEGGLHHHAAVHGRGAALSETQNADRAWISHYILRSAEEALWKWARGQGDLAANNPVQRRPLDFIVGTFLNLARPEHLVEDRRIALCARHQPRVLADLLALPGVAAADAAINARFAERLAANTQLFLDTPPAHRRIPDHARLPRSRAGKPTRMKPLVAPPTTRPTPCRKSFLVLFSKKEPPSCFSCVSP